MTWAAKPGATCSLGGEVVVSRIGFGAMRLTGEGVWGPPADRDAAVAVLRRAVDLGVTFIDTADAYGPHASEELIADALFPYPDGLVIATKGGLLRPRPLKWDMCGRPSYLRQCVEMSLRRLRLDRIDLYQLHAIDPLVPIEESLGALDELQGEGKIRMTGLSNVSVHTLERALRSATIVSVQNLYNLLERSNSDVLDACTAAGIAFIPWNPVGTGTLTQPSTPVGRIAAAHDATPAQVALAWLLACSPVVLPIPGTTSIPHLEENVGALALRLTLEDIAALSAIQSD
jgi:pyridoxine 4-dehydrogenase